MSRINCLFLYPEAPIPSEPKGRLLFDDLRDRACAHGVAAFANREAQTLFESYWGNECHFTADVVPRHHHLYARRQFHIPGDVRGAEVKLWPVAREKRRVPPAFFLR